MNKKMILVFQRYEIDLILSALGSLRREEDGKCKWERQLLTEEFGYTLNRKIKHIDFVINSINRQLDIISIMSAINSIDKQLDIISKMEEEKLCL